MDELKTQAREAGLFDLLFPGIVRSLEGNRPERVCELLAGDVEVQTCGAAASRD